MKKVFTILCFSLLLFSAKNASAQADIDKGNVLLNLGLGAGYYNGGGVPFVASAEWAINDAISIGPYLGLTSWRNNIAGIRYSYTFFDLGVRGSYHFTKHLNINTDQLDLYGTVFLGYRGVSGGYDGPFGYDDPYDGYLRLGVTGGARWYFSDKFAVNAELGYGVSTLLIGVTFKLGN